MLFLSGKVVNVYEMCAQLRAREVGGDWEEYVKMRNELG